jgi:hypothetical protein
VHLLPEYNLGTNFGASKAIAMLTFNYPVNSTCAAVTEMLPDDDNSVPADKKGLDYYYSFFPIPANKNMLNVFC